MRKVDSKSHVSKAFRFNCCTTRKEEVICCGTEKQMKIFNNGDLKIVNVGIQEQITSVLK